MMSLTAGFLSGQAGPSPPPSDREGRRVGAPEGTDPFAGLLAALVPLTENPASRQLEASLAFAVGGGPASTEPREGVIGGDADGAGAGAGAGERGDEAAVGRAARDTPDPRALLLRAGLHAAAHTAGHSGSLKPSPVPDAVHQVNRDPAFLEPAFRERLDRVVERLRSEHGIQATFLEGFRPQLRQEHLYAQGRSAPGPVVTWTRNSLHTQGRAADLRLEGGVGGAEAYRILHRIAGEEGLRTLGMRDPGHVELPRLPQQAGAGSSPIPELSGELPEGEGTRPPQADRPGANGGTVAAAHLDPRHMDSVARVAAVARVASPAAVGRPRGSAILRDALPATPAPPDGASPPPERRGEGAGPTEESLPDGDHRLRGGAAETRGAAPPEAAASRGTPPPEAAASRGAVPLEAAAPPEPGSPGQRGSHPLTGGAESTRGPSTAERVAGVEQLRATAPLPPLRRVELRDVDGQGTRVRVELQGDRVKAGVRSEDGGLLGRLHPAVGELEGALQRHGLELGRLQVAGTRDAPGPLRDEETPAESRDNGPFGEEGGDRDETHQGPGHHGRNKEERR